MIRRYCLTILIMLIGTVPLFGQGLKIQVPYLDGFHPLDAEPNEFSMLKAARPVLLTLKSKLFVDTSKIDFEKRQISFRRTDSLGYVLWEYHYGELSDYLSERRNFALGRDWKRASIDAMKADATKSNKNVGKFQWELPVQYPSWAQRIMGNDPPRLTIDGSLKLTIGFNNSTNLKGKDDSSPDKTSDFKLDEEYDFSVTGTVGRLINVNIKSNSQNSFDFSDNLQNFKIEYKESTPGELEDEIIQEVSAGYTSFDMKGTQLTGNVDAKKGLFGIKIKSQIGPLTLTTIAATENGVSNTKTFSSSSGTNSSSNSVDQYAKNKFFYLDNFYRDHYIKKYALKNGNRKAAAPEVDTLHVWIKNDGSQAKKDMAKANGHRSAYIIEGAEKLPYNRDSISKTQIHDFIPLKQNIHYKLDNDDGYIQFTDSLELSSTDMVAIYMRSKDLSLNKGLYYDTTGILWVLKPVDEIDSLAEDPLRYNLMWRNVYTMSGNTEDLTNYKLSVVRKDQDNKEDKQKEYDKNSANKYYGELVGLTDDKGKPLVQNNEIFDKKNRVIIIPPYDTTKYGDFPFTNPDLKTEADTLIYTCSQRSRTSHVTKLYINGSGSSSGKNPYVKDIDFGVIPGTDKVWADNVELERDKDYVINYDMGTLELLSIRAKAANSIKADYQTESMFSPDKKVFLGMNGQVQLPFLSDKSFIGATILYQNVKVSEETPRLGQEPYSKFLFDVNTSIDLEPEWMTRLVNKLPLIETSASSQVKFDLEVAHSSMEPNAEGKAYIDDFEDSKISDQLGSTDDSWYQASPPQNLIDTLHRAPPAWNFYWFSPSEWDNENRVLKRDIYKIKSGSTEQDGTASVLRLHCKPAPKSPIYQPQYKNTWAGIMTPIPISFADKNKEKYLEFLVRVVDAKGNPGKLKIQMGEMREDLSLNGGIPNGSADREDTSLTRDDYYSKELDKGLDGLTDDKEFFLMPRADGKWDTLSKSKNPAALEEFANDPGKDNFSIYDKDHKQNYRYKSKTQNDEVLGTEDIDRNGTVETSIDEKYFEFTVDLQNLQDTTKPYFTKDTSLVPGGNWYRIRIPLKEDNPNYPADYKKVVGGPSWDRIRMVRLIWTGFDQSHPAEEYKLAISEMGFVGNQWEAKLDTTGTKIEALAISNKDGGDYVVPHSITLKYDRSTKEYDREQSLQLKFNNLRSGKEAIVTKNLNQQKFDLTAYKNLKLLVYGKRKAGEPRDEPLNKGRVKFVFRFGTDSTTYYEYRKEIMPEWQNDISIDLQKIARQKDAYMVLHPDTSIADTGGVYNIVAPKGRQPNLSNISWMALGVMRLKDNDPAVDSGEIWVNEMIASGIDNINGWAARGELKTKWADLFDLSTRMSYTSGDYRTMQDVDKAAKDSKMDATVSASMNLDKFLPKDWGVNIPIGTVIGGSVTRPQLKNNDVPINSGANSNELVDMASDVIKTVLRKDNVNGSDLYGTQNVSTNIYTGYDKSSPSENPITGLIADRTSGTFSYTNAITESRDGLGANGELYAKTDTTDTYLGSLKYDLSPRETPQWTKWKPVKNDSSFQWLSELKNYEFALLPSQIKFNLADANYAHRRSRDIKNGTSENIHTLGLKHGFNFEYTPIAPLIGFNYDLAIDRDLDTIADQKGDILNYVFKRSDDDTWKRMCFLYGEQSRTQKASVKVNPQLVDWFTNSIDYSSTYSGKPSSRRQDTTRYLDSKVDLSFSFNSTIDFDDLLSKLISNNNKKKNPDSTLIAIDKGFKKLGFRQISFNYSAISNLYNYYQSPSSFDRMDKFDFFLYQIGSKGRSFSDVLSGDMDDYRAFGGMRYRNGEELKELYDKDSRTVNQTYKFSTAFDLKVPFEISFNPISFGWSNKFTVTPDSTEYDSTFSFPEISVSARTPALMKVGVVSDVFSTMDLNSSFSYIKSIGKENLSSDTSERYDCSPLISLTGTVKKWPINVNFSHKYTKEIKQAGLIKTDRTANGDELNITYEIEKNSRLSEIKILHWTIPVKGKTKISLRASYDKIKTVEEGETANPENEELRLLLNPQLTYIFTDAVEGTLQWAATQNHQNDDINKRNEFALIINIKFK